MAAAMVIIMTIWLLVLVVGSFAGGVIVTFQYLVPDAGMRSLSLGLAYLEALKAAHRILAASAISQREMDRIADRLDSALSIPGTTT